MSVDPIKEQTKVQRKRTNFKVHTRWTVFLRLIGQGGGCGLFMNDPKIEHVSEILSVQINID